VRALLWPLFARSPWDQIASVVVGKTGKGAALLSVRFVVVGQESHCGASTTGVGAALASVPSVGVGQVSHCCDGHER
jgi:hypothetical protein